MKSSKGFTLIELMIVVAIVGIFAAVLIPALSRTDQGPQAEVVAKKFAEDMYRLNDVKAQCMNIDTDRNGYVSCTVAGYTGQNQMMTVPIECATVRMLSNNQGCRSIVAYR